MLRINNVFITLLPPMFLLFCTNSYAQQHEHMGGDHSEAVNHMHHQLEEDQAQYKKQEAQVQKELNEMTIREDVDIDEVYTKIDELMAAKTQILRLRYEHLIEMRKILSEEQRVEYDKRVLQRSEIR
jgi:hypothetical protein